MQGFPNRARILLAQLLLSLQHKQVCQHCGKEHRRREHQQWPDDQPPRKQHRLTTESYDQLGSGTASLSEVAYEGGGEQVPYDGGCEDRTEEEVYPPLELKSVYKLGRGERVGSDVR